MGNDESTLTTGLNSSEYLNSDYLCLFFCRGDRIKVILGNEETRRVVIDSVKTFLSMNRVKDRNYYITIVCSGQPFQHSQGSELAIAIKSMACHILQELYCIGWILLFSSNLTRENDVTSLFFRRSTPERQSQNVSCIALSQQDALYFLRFPEQLKPVIKECAKSSYRCGVQSTSDKGETAFKVKLRGTPWFSTGGTKWAGRELLLSLVQFMEQNNLCFYGTGDLKGTGDTLFFMHGVTYAAQHATYCILSLDGNDKLRVLRLPDSVLSPLRELISKVWRPGIQSEGPYLSAYEFKLRGTPWWASGEESIASRHLVVQVLKCLQNQGFKVLATLGISRKITDKSAFILRSIEPGGATISQYMCISMNETDKLRLIDFSEQELVNRVRDVIRRRWTAGIQSEKSYMGGAAHQFKLNGNPWGHDRHQGVAARALMCCILQLLETEGWHVISSADVSAKYYSHSSNKGGRRTNHPLDIDSWFLARTLIAPGEDACNNSAILSVSPEDYKGMGPAEPSAPPEYELVVPPPAYPADPSAPPEYGY